MAESKCPHDQGIYCPDIEAPRVTELKEGTVQIKYTVLPSGSVSDIEVLESTGDPRWVQAVTGTVHLWKYKKSQKEYKQEFKFSAVLGP
ncbi:TonB family protein [Spongiibacter sp. KMU-158]|uniref:TonB family protein n=1 Tax=Spongiibacter pelagi TaxID=2760804 RepID=A0A927BY55_9GAMM|nr:TonB family protein [Spongiibacter pelagi]